MMGKNRSERGEEGRERGHHLLSFYMIYRHLQGIIEGGLMY
jgi:hypothetical protein